jgi:hypothetical protein
MRTKRLKPGLAAWLATLLILPMGASAAPGDFVNGTLSTCFWNYGAIAGTPDAYNVAYPDGGAIYWAAGFRRLPGSALKLRGQFPHARYTSLIAYNRQGRGQDGLADYQIDPDAGSTNPFRPGADRNATQRSYTVNVLDLRNLNPATGLPLYNNTNPKSDELPRNDLYSKPDVPFTEVIGGTTYQNTILVLRIYVPDKGLDFDGGVPLPEPELTLADGTRLTGQALCDAVDSESKDRVANGLGLRLPDPSTLVIDQRTYQALRHSERLTARCNVLAANCPTTFTVPPALVQVPRQVDALIFPATDPPTWRGAYDRRYQLQLYTGNDAPGASMTPPKNEGGFFPNMHNNYVRVALNRNFGKAVVMRARLPKSPQTWHGQATLPTGSFETRYTSLCLKESMRSTRVQDCVFDEEMPTDQRGFYTVVISRTEDRPSNPSEQCGRAWIEWSPRGDGEDEPLRDPDFGLLGIRNMLPDPSFAEAIQNTQTPGDEKQVMGDYLPTVTYMSPADVENAGCTFGGLQVPINADGSGTYKLGRTIPVKFRLDDAAGMPSVDAVAKLDVAPVTNGAPGAYVPARSPSQGGSTFASLGNGVYHYNLSTTPLSAGLWSLRVTFKDGTEQFTQLTLH